jgi:hypothetical protein
MRGGAHSESFEHFEARARCVQTELRALAAGEIDERLDGRLEQVQRRFGVAEVGREVVVAALWNARELVEVGAHELRLTGLLLAAHRPLRSLARSQSNWPAVANSQVGRKSMPRTIEVASAPAMAAAHL